jgi:hypothetical protein
VTFVIGLDIGNATTEAVAARLRDGQVEVVAADRVRTRGGKGSAGSIAAGAGLVQRLVRQVPGTVERVTVTPLRPVLTETLTVAEPGADTGRVAVLRAGAETAGGEGTGVGRPIEIGTDPDARSSRPDEPLVAVVPSTIGYAAAVPVLQRLLSGGRLVAVVLEADEAVLLANRLPGAIPVVDGVPSRAALAADRLAVEVRSPGGALRALTDPFWTLSNLGPDLDAAAAAQLAAVLGDVSNAVVATTAGPAPTPGGDRERPWVELAGAGRQGLGEAQHEIRTWPPGSVRAYGSGSDSTPVDDLFCLDLAAVADQVGARRGSLGSRALAVAALRAGDPVDPAPALSAHLGLPVCTVGDEAAAARLGALSTPGVGPGATVVDVGAGTVDVVTADGAVVAAGAGELLTVATASLLGTTRAAAEWAKRGPGFRVESPQVLLGEDGSRRFLDSPARPETVGALVVEAPVGLLPFDRRHAPSEWRALRRRVKQDGLGANLLRALSALSGPPGPVVLVGGPASDDEVVTCVAAALPDGTPVGRGNAAGRLGHRYAVAYGLLCLLAES